MKERLGREVFCQSVIHTAKMVDIINVGMVGDLAVLGAMSVEISNPTRIWTGDQLTTLHADQFLGRYNNEGRIGVTPELRVLGIAFKMFKEDARARVN